MSQQELDARIGEAWQAHYDGQHRAAIDKFKKIIDEVPDHIDANWGLGLSYRKAGDRENALKIFRKVQELVTKRLDAAPEDDYERYFMLKRMVSQQVDQMSDFLE